MDAESRLEYEAGQEPEYGWLAATGREQENPGEPGAT